MFRIGEFSKIAQVSARQLRHYDKLGLLTPEHTDPMTGYRFYTATQLPRLNRILALKELGLSLDQIARMLNEEVSTDEMRGMLAMKKAQLEQQLREELARFRYIESRIAQIDAEGSLIDYEVVLKTVPEQRFLAVRELCYGIAHARDTLAEMRRILPGHVSMRSLGHLTAVIHSEMFEFDEIDMEFGFVLEDPDVTGLEVPLSDGNIMTIRTMPAVEHMLTSVRIGRFEEGHQAYSALGIWMEAQGYRIAGPGREVLIQPAMPGKEDEAVAEIQLPVAKIDPNYPLIA